jgi:pimeloyl-ACP methyl ester carboxylesterase
VRLILNKAFFDCTKVSPSAINAYAANLARADGLDMLIKTVQQNIGSDINVLISTFQNIDVPTLLIWGQQDRLAFWDGRVP